MDEAEKKDEAEGVARVTDESPDDAGVRALRLIRHDFKTPLTSLRILGQIFKTSLEKGTLATQPERTARNITILIEQIDKLVGLADNLYEISLAQSGLLNIERQHADLRPILIDATARNEAQVREVDLPAQPVWGDWDVGKLTQAFGCLLAEAVSVSLVLRPEPEGNTASVLLTGEYKPFNEKTSPSRYIARQIIEKHGGNLKDRFEVTLPLKFNQ
ncbi:MAG: HAMP domain-containing histidine kinase [Deltaproteobacteria bacterium]|nr:HAMP domain-containing histidine kinase [Deltaproteobacteria bacterium]